MDEQLIGNRHIFRGFTDSIIFWNKTTKAWHLELYHDKVCNTIVMYQYLQTKKECF
jgi:hypothetical protein